MLTAAKETDSCCSPPSKEGEHSSSPNVFVCVPLLLKFLSTLFDIRFLFLVLRLSVLATRNISFKQDTPNDEN